MNKKISSQENKTILLELMDDIHQFCVSNNIKYSLAYGTLIGVMRHQGFIPWDDDIDIYMMRDDYDRFRLSYIPQKSYIKLNDCEQNNSYHRSFLKVEDTRTVVIEKSALDYVGISIDVFPVDNLCDNIEDSKKLCSSVSLIRRFHMIKTLSFDNNIKWYKKIIMCVGKILLCLWSTHSVTLKLVNLSKRGKKNSKYVGIMDMDHNERLIFERTIYENVILRNFEDRKYYTMEKADMWLSRRYGNYMELPPESERENGSGHEFSCVYYK